MFVGLIRATLFFLKNIFTGQKLDMTELKLLWPFNMSSHGPKIILSTVRRKETSILSEFSQMDCNFSSQ